MLSHTPTARLELICGPMFAGKTTELIRRVAHARESGLRVLVLKPARDTRYAEDAIVTHGGSRLEARSIANTDALLSEAHGHAVVAIDEIHFFASAACAPIAQLLAAGTHVIVAGCDLDHFGEVFAPFDELFPIASSITRLAGACTKCAAPSTHSQRMSSDASRIVVGGKGAYEPRCERCFVPHTR